MAGLRSLRLFSLVQREVQEYKGSFIWTPIVIAAALSLIMLVSVILANSISVMGDTMLQVIMAEEAGIDGGGATITINIDDNDNFAVDIDAPVPPDAPAAPEVERDYTIESVEEPVVEEDWNFSREWTFSPQQRDKSEYELDESVGSLNPALNVMHSFMLLVLLLVSAHYLLSCLYTDRKDRSILFWKSMPVSEREEVLVRFTMALVVVPAFYIGLSLILQMLFVLAAMLMLWRMEMDPFVHVLGNIEFGQLLRDQLGGWILTALWVAPAYAWLMLASAWAKRSPFLVAVAPVIALMLLEGLVLGSDFVLAAITRHVPHYVGGDSDVGFYIHGLLHGDFDYLSLFCGLVFAAIAITGAIYLRRYRFEI